MPHAGRLLSVIIPVFNEQSTISEVIEKVLAVELPIAKEIIVVDDGSTDATVERLECLRANVAAIHVAELNEGKGSAVRIGLGLAQGDIILIQDADLELDPTEYNEILEPILAGRVSVVFGSRFLGRSSVRFGRRFPNYVLTAVTNALFGTSLTDMGTAYKAFTKEAADRIRLTANRFEIDPELTAQFIKTGYAIEEVPISYRPRTRNEGKKIRWTDGIAVIKMLFRQRFLK